eukprot:347569-Chlamydomonas_euryale.AAC.1
MLAPAGQPASQQGVSVRMTPRQLAEAPAAYRNRPANQPAVIILGNYQRAPQTVTPRGMDRARQHRGVDTPQTLTPQHALSAVRESHRRACHGALHGAAPMARGARPGSEAWHGVWHHLRFHAVLGHALRPKAQCMQPCVTMTGTQ